MYYESVVKSQDIPFKIENQKPVNFIHQIYNKFFYVCNIDIKGMTFKEQTIVIDGTAVKDIVDFDFNIINDSNGDMPDCDWNVQKLEYEYEDKKVLHLAIITCNYLQEGYFF